MLDLAHNPEWAGAALRKTAVCDVWGIGRRWSAMLEERCINTALDLANAQDGWVRPRMGIVGLRTVHELRGLVCHALADQPAPSQTTYCSRTFGEAIRDKSQVHDAVMGFAKRVAGAVQLFIRTDPFEPNAAQKSVSGSATFQRPTSGTRDITDAVLRIFDRIWRDGYGWRKAAVLLLDLAGPSAVPASLFDVIEQPDELMDALDQINARFGRVKARLGLAGKNAEWRIRQENLSPSFTTRWNGLPLAKIR